MYAEGIQEKHSKVKDLDFLPTISRHMLYDPQKKTFNMDERNFKKTF